MPKISPTRCAPCRRDHRSVHRPGLRSARVATLLAFGILAGAPLGLASAQTIYAEYRSGSTWKPLPGFPNRALGQQGLPSGSDVTIELTGFQTIRVFADQPDLTDVGTITVTAPAGIIPNVQVTALAIPNFTSAAPKGPKAFRRVGAVIAPASVVMLHADTITGSGVEARQILRVDLTGDLDAPLIHWGEPSGSTSRGVAAINIDGSTTERAPIVAVNGSITRLAITGDANGSIGAQNGGINTLFVGGDLGSPSATTSVYAWSGPVYYAIADLEVGGTIGTPDRPVEIATGGPVRMIEADAIHAHIDTTLDPNDLGFFGGMTTRNGDFTGSLIARTLTSFGRDPGATCALKINGDFDAFVYFENGTRNERPDAPEIDIAGAIKPGAVLSLATLIFSDPSLPGAQVSVGADNGLGGQIIAGNEVAISFADPNSIVIGTQNKLVVTPGTRFYEKTADELGGGAIGIAPFNFHQRECFPRHNETVNLAEGERLEAAVIRLYGPAYSALAQPAFVIEHRATPTAQWTDRSDDFIVTLAENEADASRRIDVTGYAGAFFGPGEWRLRPQDDSIRCAFVRGTPTIRFDSEYDDDTYRFVVTGGCQPGQLSGPDPVQTPTASRTPSGGGFPTRAEDIDGSISPDNDCP